jgi:predicted MFS family arabinose efflux permease
MPGRGTVPAVTDADSRPGPWRALGMLCTARVLSMTSWFSATALTPELRDTWKLSGPFLVWLTNGVQIGFVIGALALSLVNLPDIIRLNRLMAASAAMAAVANASLLFEPGQGGLLLARATTGIALAGLSSRTETRLDLVRRRKRIGARSSNGALTLGSASPHLFRALSGSLDWRVVVVTATLSTLAGAVTFLLYAREGPIPFGKAIFDPRQIGAVFCNKPLMYATAGYLGHMWELYAMWTWLLTFNRAALKAQGGVSESIPSLITFIAISMGMIGCVAGGLLSDRFGRTFTTAGMMIVSGTCAAFIGFTFDGPFWLFALVSLFWGISVVGDSAQFSAAATELADPRYVGTALSVQLGLGFTLTVGAIWLMPRVAHELGSWQWAFLVLAIGPFSGVAAMLALRLLSESLKMAGGRQ